MPDVGRMVTKPDNRITLKCMREYHCSKEAINLRIKRIDVHVNSLIHVDEAVRKNAVRQHFMLCANILILFLSKWK